MKHRSPRGPFGRILLLTGLLVLLIILISTGIISFHMPFPCSGNSDSSVLPTGQGMETRDGDKNITVFENLLNDSQDNLSSSDSPDAIAGIGLHNAEIFQSGSRYSTDELINISVYDKCNKAVVNITTEIVGYNWFLEPVPQQGSSGSGSIIDSKGYILTNNHVVENAYKVNVTLADGSQYEGDVVGTDVENDLAVVKIEPGKKELVTIDFGDSSLLKVGQKVLAIGNPFAFQRTLTVGIISGLGRPLRNDKGIIIRDMIQTDASINPGNSGGPLLDSHGRIIGVNTMIYSPSGGSVGIGFAVPVDTARRVVPDLIKYGYVRRGWIDIEPVQLFPSLVRYASLPVSEGILVSRVRDGGNADKAGIRGGKRQRAVRSGSTVIYLGGDIITAIDGEPVKSLGDFYAALERSRPGDVVNVSVIRGNRKMQFKVKLSSREN